MASVWRGFLMTLSACRRADRYSRCGRYGFLLRSRLHSFALGAHRAPGQSPKRGHISFVVARQIDGRLENERPPRKQTMIQNPAKCFEPDLAFADVLVPVDARTVRHLRIVGMDHRRNQPTPARYAEALLRDPRPCEYPSPRRKDERCRCTCRSEAPGKDRSPPSTPRVARRARFPVPRCFRAGCAGRQASDRAQPASAIPRSPPRPPRPSFRAGSQDEPPENRPQARPREQFPDETPAPTRAQHRIRRCQIDQIIRVDDQRPKRELLAPRAKSHCVGLDNPRRAASPHPRTRRKNLQRVGAEAVSDIQSASNVACDGRMNADADVAVFPSRNFGCGRRLGAILVSVVEG